MTDYSKMTTDEEVSILDEIIREDCGFILTIGNVYSELREHYNNEILDRWAAANPEKAYPEEIDD